MEYRSGFLSVAALLGFVACSSNGPGSSDQGIECKTNDDCQGGEVCSEGKCIDLCLNNIDCPEGLICNVTGICVEGDLLPVIANVIGNGPAERIADGILVSGLNLGEATLELLGDSGAVNVTLLEQADTRVELVFPAEITAGVYALVATNSWGTDQQEVTLTLPELTGDVLLERINTGATGKVAMARLPVGTTAGTVAEGTHSHGVADLPLGSVAGTVAAGNHSHRFQAQAMGHACSEPETYGDIRWTGSLFEGCTASGWMTLSDVSRRDGSSAQHAGLSCQAILQAFAGSADGLYWIDPDGPTGDDPVQTYCDMTTDAGGWSLVGYSFMNATDGGLGSHNLPSLRCGGGDWNPVVRTTAGAIDATDLVKTSTDIAFSMRTDHLRVETGNMQAYNLAYKIEIPDPAKVHFKNHSTRGPFSGDADDERGPCVKVIVRGIHGTVWSDARYTNAHAMGISWGDSYPSGYGAGNTSSCGTGFDDGPFITSIHSSSYGTTNHGTVVNECDVDQGSSTYAHRGNYTHDAVNTTGSAAVWLR